MQIFKFSITLHSVKKLLEDPKLRLQNNAIDTLNQTQEKSL